MLIHILTAVKTCKINITKINSIHNFTRSHLFDCVIIDIYNNILLRILDSNQEELNVRTVTRKFSLHICISTKTIGNAKIWCRNYDVLYLETLFIYAVFIWLLPPGNKNLYSLLVQVLWHLLEPHIYHFHSLVFLPISTLTNGILHPPDRQKSDGDKSGLYGGRQVKKSWKDDSKRS